MMLATSFFTLVAMVGGEAFSDLDHDAALAKATGEGKPLMLDFTASWCPGSRWTTSS